MTESLQKAFDAASQLPPNDQDAFAEWVLAELQSEEKWRKRFDSSTSQLAALAEEALAEHARGETEDMDSQ